MAAFNLLLECDYAKKSAATLKGRAREGVMIPGRRTTINVH